MKKLLLLLLLLQNAYCFSQTKNYKFLYKLNYVQDSLKINEKKDELFTLFYDDTLSTFVSNKKIIIDSLRNEANKNPAQGLSLLADVSKFQTKFGFTITKRILQNSCITKKRVYKDLFEYEEKLNNIKWEIYQDTLTVLNLKCNKATTTFSGRKYTAWYCAQIPIHDGPYKFNGLPGLILKIYDSKSNFDFELIGIEKWNNKLPLFNNDEKIIKTTKQGVQKAEKNFKENFVTMVAQNGFQLSEEGKKFKEKQNKEASANPIELE
jgi:GLPGLI family protein